MNSQKLTADEIKEFRGVAEQVAEQGKKLVEVGENVCEIIDMLSLATTEKQQILLFKSVIRELLKFEKMGLPLPEKILAIKQELDLE